MLTMQFLTDVLWQYHKYIPTHTQTLSCRQHLTFSSSHTLSRGNGALVGPESKDWVLGVWHSTWKFSFIQQKSPRSVVAGQISTQMTYRRHVSCTTRNIIIVRINQSKQKRYFAIHEYRMEKKSQRECFVGFKCTRETNCGSANGPLADTAWFAYCISCLGWYIWRYRT